MCASFQKHIVLTAQTSISFVKLFIVFICKSTKCQEKKDYSQYPMEVGSLSVCRLVSDLEFLLNEDM